MSGVDLTRHYGDDGLAGSLDEVLASAGLGEGLLSPVDLAAIDQFHTRGLVATAELAAAARIQPNDVVLDIGSGLGGPSRYLAAHYGCHVLVIDLSPSFVAAAIFLSKRASLIDKVDYRCADALALPFDAENFDVVWTQHVAMNISDRDRLYAEVSRVLRPGGRFAIYDVVAQQGRDVLFPVPWSQTPASSFLLTAAAMQTALEKQHFQIESWVDQSEAAIEWLDEQRTISKTAPPSALSLRAVMGPDFPVMARNLDINLREGRVGIVQVVMKRP